MTPAQLGVMDEEEIARHIRIRPFSPLDGAQAAAWAGGTRQRPAAVLVPLVWKDDQWHLLLTRRTELLQNHKGQVAFPGGATELEDPTPEATALREANEEIGLKPEDVTLYGRLISRPTVTDFVITPVVGKVRWPNEFVLSAMEVSHIFTIPLEWLADPAHWEERPRAFPDGTHENVIFYQPYAGETLWGISARITLDLLRALDGARG